MSKGSIEFNTGKVHINQEAPSSANSVEFSRQNEPDFEQLQEAIELAIVAARPLSGSSSNSLTDELTRLGQLKEAGVITGDEFQAIKTRLISG
jgi:hypothetical protein